MTRIGIVLVCLLVGCGPKPTPGGTVMGRVLDAETDAPLAGVVVYDSRSHVGAQTDASGHFALSQVKPGACTVRAAMMLYKESRQPTVVTEGDSTSLTFRLSRTRASHESVITTVTHRDLIFWH